MNCTEVREHLPAFLYGDLKPGETAEVGLHLGLCPHCRREQARLEHVRTVLNQAPVPTVTVDIAGVYQAAVRRQTLRLWRWRRAALVIGSVAAVLLLVLGLRLEVRFEAHQLVLRWGAAGPAADSPNLQARADRAPGEQQAASQRLEERLRLLTDLVHALAKDIEERDVQRQDDLARVQGQIAELRRQTGYRLSETQQKVAALFAVQRNLNPKGDKP